MKTAVFSSLVCVVMGAAPALAAPADAAADAPAPACQPGVIEVTGQGHARVAPDLAVLRLGVSTSADSAGAAMAANNAAQAAVIGAIRDAGVADGDIQTAGLSLSPQIDYEARGAGRVTGYQASNLVSVRVADLTRLGAVVDGAVAAGATDIQGLEFSAENAQAAQDRARADAVAQATHRAGVLAQAAGLALGPVLAIRDGADQGGAPGPMMAMEARAAAVPVEAGSVDLGAQVSMRFALPGVCE